MDNKRNIKFEKVSRDQFISSMQVLMNDNRMIIDDGIDLNQMYDDIKLPERKTANSAGYDFMLPFSFKIMEGEYILIPTGIRCKMDEDLVLSLYPRSSYGFKYGMYLMNTTGIIDSDYYNAENEGHIMAKVKFDNIDYGIKTLLRKEMTFKKGQGFIQGVFTQYMIANNDEVDTVRTGGTGSTDK